MGIGEYFVDLLLELGFIMFGGILLLYVIQTVEHRREVGPGGGEREDCCDCGRQGVNLVELN